MTALTDYFRVECAFTTSPDDANPAWVDLSSRCNLAAGISITRGRQDEHSTASPGRVQLTLDNIDGALTAERPASPYYPNVVPGKRFRVSYRDPAGASGNFLPAESASFEGGTVGLWTPAPFGGTAPTLSNSTTHASNGTKAMLITWPNATGVGATYAGIAGFGQLVIGRTYTLSARVWVPAANPGVYIGIYFGAASSISSTTGAFTTVSVAFTPTTSTVNIVIGNGANTTAGQQVWVDSVMIDEGSTVGTFTTSAPPISYRFDGQVDEWPVEWPDNGDQYAISVVTATDLLARLGQRQALQSVIAETVQLDSPAFYYPLNESEGATSVGDAVGSGNPLSLLQVGGGSGSLTFGQGTGPPTDGASAPVFAPASVGSGTILFGAMTPIGFFGSGDAALEVAFTCTTLAVQTIVQVSDALASTPFRIGIDGTGHLTGELISTWGGGTVVFSLVSSTIVTDGATHEAALLMQPSAGTINCTLLLDGVSVATGSYAGATTQRFVRLAIGGDPAGRLFTGTISHVSGYTGTAPTVARFLEHRTSMVTGFAGESSDARVARIASWVGLPAARQVLDAGASTSIAHIDSTGMSPLDYLHRIEATEQGLIYADTMGRLVFKSRSSGYLPTAPGLSMDARMVSMPRPSISTFGLTNDVTVSRPNGATAHATDAASITAYGAFTTSLDIATTSDSEVIDAANWILALGKTPRLRVPAATVDAYTDPTYSAAIRAADIGSHLQVTGLPAQASASSVDFIVQGYTEAISADSWDITANATPYGILQPLILDDTTYGVLDSIYVLAY